MYDWYRDLLQKEYAVHLNRIQQAELETDVCRFVAMLESGIRRLVQGMELRRSANLQNYEEWIYEKGIPGDRVLLAHGLPFRSEKYVLQSFEYPTCEMDGMAALWKIQNHGMKLWDWFLPENCIVLSPDSYSGRVLDKEEYNTLLSAISIALNELQASKGSKDFCIPPVFIPVFDALRDAQYGIGIRSGSVLRFESDSIHGRISENHELNTAPGWFKVFAQRLNDRDPESARCCQDIFNNLKIYGNADLPENVRCWTRRVYQLFQEDEKNHGRQGGEHEEHGDWDLGFPWYPWAHQVDPIGTCGNFVCILLMMLSAVGEKRNTIKLDRRTNNNAGGIELDVLTGPLTSLRVDSIECDELDQNLQEVSEYKLIAMDSDHEPDVGGRSFLPLQVVEVQRRFLQCIDISRFEDAQLLRCPFMKGEQSGRDSLSAKLHNLLKWYKVVCNADTISSLLYDEWWIENAEYFAIGLDSEEVQHSIQSIFSSNEFRKQKSGGHLGKSAPAGSLLENLALLMLVEDSARIVAQLWVQFVREIRFSFWDQNILLPFVDASGEGDLSTTCKLHQCLELLNYCTQALKSQKVGCHDDIPSGEIEEPQGVKEKTDIFRVREPKERINVPRTQSFRMAALEFVTNGPRDTNAGAHLFQAMLLSDMQAFKAANPGCDFEDFIRWHSPKDLVEKEDGAFELSHRMSSKDSMWMQVWEKAAPIPLERQKPIFDPHTEGEKIIHYLETMSISELLSQIFIVAYSGIFGLLRACATEATLSKQFDRLAAAVNIYLDFDFISDFRGSSILHGVVYDEEQMLVNLTGLTNTLSCIEHTLVAGKSIALRLNGIENEAYLSLLVNMMIESSYSRVPACYGASLSHQDAIQLISCLESDSCPLSADGPLSTEHSIEIHRNDSPSDSTDHRFYISNLPREMRVALSMSSAC